MTQFIKLTPTQPGLDHIYINVNKIEYMTVCFSGTTKEETRVILDGTYNDFYYHPVKETPEEIMEMINGQ